MGGDPRGDYPEFHMALSNRIWLKDERALDPLQRPVSLLDSKMEFLTALSFNRRKPTKIWKGRESESLNFEFRISSKFHSGK